MQNNCNKRVGGEFYLLKVAKLLFVSFVELCFILKIYFAIKALNDIRSTL